jgi:hypothetical protein
MTSTLTSTAPLAWVAMLGFFQAAAASWSSPVTVYPGELVGYEPASYIFMDGFIYEHKFEPESTQYQFIESYQIRGSCTVFSGDAPGNDVSIIAKVMLDTYSLYTNLVMLPIVSNRGGNGIPVLGITGTPTPYEVKPDYGMYTCGPGNIGGGAGGWEGSLKWSFDLHAYLTPA